jgi:hypothetical protein
MTSRSSLLITTAAAVALAAGALAPGARAYDYWSAGCRDCHTSFTDTVSVYPGNTWPDDKHNTHRNVMMNGLCGACHVVNGDDPAMYTSRGETGLPGQGCRGCHGVDPTPGTANFNWGAGLRLHHANAGVGPDNGGLFCVDCHSDPLPPPERTLPLYYGKTGVNVLSSCNADGSENWTSDGVGLDNDGDLLRDAADPDCPLFADGFESGNTTRWSTVVPLRGPGSYLELLSSR